MLKRIFKYPIYLFCVGILLSCNPQKPSSNPSDIPKSNTLIKYAKGFDIQVLKNGYELIITSPYPEATASLRYYIGNGITPEGATLISTPIKRVVATSTTHIPMIEQLQEESSLIGFPNTSYVSSPTTRKRIDEGLVKDIGKEASLNTELVLELRPDVLIAFSMNSSNKSLQLIERFGIPVVYNGDWLEESPLGRAEWIKVFGLLYGKLDKSIEQFKEIEKEYLAAKQLASASTKSPTILSGAIMNNDVWYLPSGDSFVAQFLKDANTSYLWKETTGKGSKSLSFEHVLTKAKQADFWIAPGYFTSKQQMLDNNQHYAEFDAFQKDKVYTLATKTGPTGGVIYYELGPTRPDLILKDIIKITHPSVLPDYELTFFEVLK